MSGGARSSGVAFAAGLLFGVGLAVAGMTDPSKVIGFLDVLGDWDPSLALVMGGAVGLNVLAYQWARRRSAPLVATEWRLPTRADVDVRLVVGAAVFGVGWGIGGFCPGPGIVSAGRGALDAVVFTFAMAAGMAVAARLDPRGKTSADEPLAAVPAPGTGA